MNDPDTSTTAPAKDRPSGEALLATYRDKLAAAYTAGATLDELSAQYRLSPSAIRARLMAWGVTLRRGGRRNTTDPRKTRKDRGRPRITRTCVICGATVIKARGPYCSRACYAIGGRTINPDATKECTQCHERKPLTDFYRHSWRFVGHGDEHHARCKVCHRSNVKRTKGARSYGEHHHHREDRRSTADSGNHVDLPPTEAAARDGA